MGYIILILFLPLIWPLIAKNIWKTTINWQEMGLNMLAVIAVGGGLFLAAGFSQTYDTEIWNGQVTGKEKNWVSCEHSYECNCVETCSGSGSNQSCSETCQTCYDHFNDWDWDVYSNVGTITIDRVDRRGSDEPRRWSIVQKGEPVALEKSYTNYVQAVPESLFNPKAVNDNSLPAVPAYPKVRDYYRANRVLPVGISIPNLKSWNDELSHVLRELGPKKQANLHVIIVNTPDQMYRYKVEGHEDWLGGNKNDVVVFLGVTDYPQIAWADVMTFGGNIGNELFHVTLRDRLYEIGTMDKDAIVSEINTQVLALYDRPQMSNFEYLKDAITPPAWMLILIFLIEMALSMGLTYYFHRNEVRFF
jgi:hypothetical protein